MATPLGKLIARLRDERGMSQAALAAASTLSIATIAVVEQKDERNVRSGTARRLYDALAAASPLAPDDLKLFSKLTGLKIDAPAERPIAPRMAASIENATALLHDAVDAIGLDKVQRILEVLAELDSDERTIRLTHPPVQRNLGGIPAVEQTTVEYRTRPPRPDAPPQRERRPG